MAVKIYTQAPATYSANCAKCGTGFTYELNDLARDYIWGGDYVPCPTCGACHRHPDQRARR